MSPEHVALPLGSPGQTVQALPHAAGSPSLAQVWPHAWYPVLHMKLQLVPSHVAWTALAGTGHGVQLVPHALTSLVLGQDWPHACVPMGHTPEHDAALSMHEPLHSFFPVGQVPPHIPAMHVAVPPFAGSVHGEHDVPQVCGLVSITHPTGHRCWPSGQVGTGGTPVSNGASSTGPSAPVPAAPV